MHVQPPRPPKGNSLRKNTLYEPFYQTPKSYMVYSVFQSARRSKSASSRGGIYIPHVDLICSRDPATTQHAKRASRSVQPYLHSSRQSPYSLLCALKSD